MEQNTNNRSASETNLQANAKQGSVKKNPLSSSSVTGVNEITDDNIGGSSAGGVAGSGGVSTNDVGIRKTSKQPLSER